MYKYRDTNNEKAISNKRHTKAVMLQRKPEPVIDVLGLKQPNAFYSGDAGMIQRKHEVMQFKKFIGNVGGVHIHMEGRYYHVKNSITGERIDFDPQVAEQVRETYKKLKKNTALHGPGLRECGFWFRKQLKILG